MSDEFNTFVDKIIEVLNERNASTYFYKNVVKYESPISQDLPELAVIFDHMIPERLNEEQARYELFANIIYKYANFDAQIQKEQVDKILADMVQWLLKNQTLKGFALSNWVDDVGFATFETTNGLVAGGRLSIRAIKQPIDIKWVGLP